MNRGVRRVVERSSDRSGNGQRPAPMAASEMPVEPRRAESMTDASRQRAPVIGVLIPTVWSVRNVVYGGVLDRLARSGASTRLFLRGIPDAGGSALPAEFSPATECDLLLHPPGHPVRGKALLDAVVRSAFSRRRRLASYGIYKRWYERDYKRRQRVRSAFIELLGTFAQAPMIFDRLCHETELMYRRSHDLTSVRTQLERCRPDMVWSTFCVSAFEQPYILAARDLGIPVVTSILSFDNLTSRGWLPEFDHYLVWNSGMREQLLRLYPHIHPDRVSVTGTPQFDFHRRPDFLWSRASTLERLELPRGSRYFLYSTSAEVLTPEEPALVARVAAMMAEHETLGDHWLVVRLHPLDDGRRWASVAAASGRIRLSSAWDEWPDPDGWTLTSSGDQARLVSTIAHCDACVNVASTMSLDAAILDRPVVNIDFSTERDSPRELLYEEYGADHYRPLVESEGIRIAHSWAELGSLLEAAVSDPGRDRARREQMVRRECGVVDGEAATRVADELLALMGRIPPRRSGERDALDSESAPVAGRQQVRVRDGHGPAVSRQPPHGGDATSGVE